MSDEGATVESVEGEIVEPVDDAWLDDDGRDHGAEPTPALASAVWWCVAAGVMLLLPRQWGAAGIAFAIAFVVYLVKRRKHPPAPKKKVAEAPRGS